MANKTEEESLTEVLLQKISAVISDGQQCIDLSSLENYSAEIPEQVFIQFPAENLVKIVELNLDFNDFERLPENITRLNCLTKLSVEGNNLTKLPSNFGCLAYLQELRLNENRLCELPASFASLKTLRILSLQANELAFVPTAIVESLGHLEELYLDENEIFELPENFGLLKSLRVLELSENKLRSLPQSFGELHKLEVLGMSKNKISELPRTFGNLGKLRTVDLSDNDISTLPDKFLSAAIIETLHLDNNILGLLPEWFGQLSNIVCLSLNDNKLQGSPLPNAFPKKSRDTLKKLEIGGNAMSNLPESIGILNQLQELHLGSTICELERRNFQNGNWLRELPDSFGNLCSIKKLYLDENQLVRLPNSFGNLCSLTWLDLGQNLLPYLPDSFCDLVLLEYCQLSKNELICLPSDFGKLQRLKDLRLDSNMLEELPESCAKLQALHTLDLFNNKLTSVPGWLSKLSSLKRLDLDSNKLSLKLKDIPHLASKGSKYATRDPNLKDNWRGKIRADKVRAEVVVINSVDETNGDDHEEQEGAMLTTYNEGALFAAMRRGLSIWRSHDGPDERLTKQTYENNLDDVVFNVFEDVIDNNSYVNESTGLYLKLDKKSDSDFQDGSEDWDKEINELWGKTPSDNPLPEMCIGVEVSEVEHEKRNEFLATLSAYPPATQAYSSTATYESMAYKKLCGKYDICNSLCGSNSVPHAVAIQGQFEDAE